MSGEAPIAGPLRGILACGEFGGLRSVGFGFTPGAQGVNVRGLAGKAVELLGVSLVLLYGGGFAAVGASICG